MAINEIQHKSEHASCPVWKKVSAGVLTVIAAALLIPGTVWVDQLEVSWTEMLSGLAMAFGYGVVLVLAGVALVTMLLWTLSRIGPIMEHGRSAIEYIVNCFPQPIKNRILHH